MRNAAGAEIGFGPDGLSKRLTNPGVFVSGVFLCGWLRFSSDNTASFPVRKSA
jgi:hypothetical protein